MLPSTRFLNRRTLLLLPVALCLLTQTFALRAQQPQPTPQEQADDVISVTTELVQTDVMVFDKQGRFVDGLRPEQFELRVGGAVQEIPFFERVTAGSQSEAAQLEAARRGAGAATANNPDQSAIGERGRLIFFFVDDLHLSAASLSRARTALRRYVNQQMTSSDQVAIVSSSGQVGFLQQLTDNENVLHAAIKRLGYKQNLEAYTGKTQISEYAASQILDYGNRELYAYLLESIKVEQQTGPGIRHGDHRLAASYSSGPTLRNRLKQVNSQAQMATEGTLAALRSLMLSSATVPGRKLVFFLSDGFIVNERKAGALQLLREITAEAASAGAVVYTMDVRGTSLSLGAGVDASTNEYTDLSGRRAGLSFREIHAMQEPLQIIADETGGRAIFNSNDIDEGIEQAISETSNYYLLAWRPDSEELRESRAQVKVSIKGHPELRVRLRANSFIAPAALKTEKQTGKAASSDDAGAANEKVKAEKPAKAADGKAADKRAGDKKAADEKSAAAQANDAALLAALGSLYPLRDLPVSVAVGYLNTSEQGTLLRISMQTERSAFGLDPQSGGDEKALVDVAGAALDDRGQFGSFKQLLTLTPAATPEADAQSVIWHQQLRLKPGLYQVRVALRDRASGRTGSAMQWIEIPDLSQGSFTLSSLFLGERRSEPTATTAAEAGPRAILVDVDHRFQRTSVLRFQTYLYNAERGAAGAPDLQVQARVLRDRRQVMTTAPTPVPVMGDTARLSFWSELALDTLAPGRYVLEVTATDCVGHRTASQRINFFVE